ncbi:MAG: ankyrin repeat domain-containing protein [Sumerlaeia bacterium]
MDGDALLQAVREGDVGAVRAAASAGLDLERSLALVGLTPLMVDYLLDRGVDPHLTTPTGETALHLAIRGGRGDVVETILRRHDIRTFAESNNRQPLLHFAIYASVLDPEQPCLVRSLLDSGADPNHAGGPMTSSPAGERGSVWPALHLAASFGHGAACDALLGAGADPNQRTSDNDTALHLSAAADDHGLGGNISPVWDHGARVFHGRPCVRWRLLASGANPNLLNNRGETPLHIAVRRSQRDIVAVLLRWQADPMAPDPQGRSPLSQARGRFWWRASELGRMLKRPEVFAGAEVRG